MVSIPELKKMVKESDNNLNETEIEKLISDMYALVNLAFDYWVKNKHLE